MWEFGRYFVSFCLVINYQLIPDYYFFFLQYVEEFLGTFIQFSYHMQGFHYLENIEYICCSFEEIRKEATNHGPGNLSWGSTTIKAHHINHVTLENFIHSLHLISYFI